MRSGWRSCCCGSSTTLTSSAYERWCTTQTRSTSCRPAAPLRSSPARRPLRPRNPVEASTLSRRAASLSPPRRPVGSGVPQRRRALRRLARKGPLQGGRCAGLLCAGAAGRHHHRRRHHHHRRLRRNHRHHRRLRRHHRHHRHRHRHLLPLPAAARPEREWPPPVASAGCARSRVHAREERGAPRPQGAVPSLAPPPGWPSPWQAQLSSPRDDRRRTWSSAPRGRRRSSASTSAAPAPARPTRCSPAWSGRRSTSRPRL